MDLGLLGAVGYLSLAYLIGAIPFGLLVARAFNLGDLRGLGSGNTGATNVLRTGNKVAAALTLAFDMGKGAVVIGLAAMLFAPDLTGWFIGTAVFAVVLGHCFSPFLQFSGGKGVATFLGALLMVDLPTALLVCLCWLVVAALWRQSSRASLSASAAAPVLVFFTIGGGLAFGLVATSALIWWRHKDNIARLWDGTEPRIMNDE